VEHGGGLAPIGWKDPPGARHLRQTAPGRYRAARHGSGRLRAMPLLLLPAGGSVRHGSEALFGRLRATRLLRLRPHRTARHVAGNDCRTLLGLLLSLLWLWLLLHRHLLASPLSAPIPGVFLTRWWISLTQPSITWQ